MPKRKAIDDSPLPRLVKVYSGALKEDITLIWKIENFLAVLSSPELLHKQQFIFEAGVNHKFPTKWSCTMEANKENKVTGIHVALLSSPQNDKVVASCKFRSIKPAGDISHLESSDPKIFSQTMSWRCTKIIPEGKDAINGLIWKDGSISIQINFTLYLDQTTVVQRKLDLDEEINKFEKQELRNLSTSLVQVLGATAQSNSFGQVVMLSKDHVSFHVHKSILSARSPVFGAMLTNGNWKEANALSDGGGTVFCEDLTGKALHVLLHYIYGGILLDDWKDESVILQLVWAARKYQLDSLSLFLDKILSVLTISNTEILAKLALLTKRLEMKNSEKCLFDKLKEVVVDIDQLILDKNGSLLGFD